MSRQTIGLLTAPRRSAVRGIGRILLLAMILSGLTISLPGYVGRLFAQDPPMIDPATGAPIPPAGTTTYDDFIEYLAIIDPSLLPSAFPIPPRIDEFDVTHPNSDEWIVFGHVSDVDGPNEGLLVKLHGALEGVSTLTLVDGYFLVVVHEVPFSEGWIGATAFDVTGLESQEEGTFYTP